MNSDPGILALGTANPPRRYAQKEIYELMARHSPFYASDRVGRIFMNSDIESRHFFFDLETFSPTESPDELHRRFRDGAMAIGEEAVLRCLADGNIPVQSIDFIVAVSCTGYLCPGLSSLLSKQLGMRHDIQRADLVGMGCAGAMPGLQRACDYVKAYPSRKALVITVEICSACYYLDDSLETVVGNAICGDGAAAIVIGMSDRPLIPRIESFETLLEPAYIDKVGFEQRDGKLRIVLSKDLRDISGGLAKRLIDRLLSKNGLAPEAVSHWILHSGGRKVIDSIQKTMDLPDDRVRHSKQILKRFGNMSSPTVLFVLQEVLRSTTPRPGDVGVMLAMGPGLALEAALLRW